MTIRKATLTAVSIITMAAALCSCQPRRRWYSTYKDKNGNTQTEHYNEYKMKWYKKNVRNGQLWK